MVTVTHEMVTELNNRPGRGLFTCKDALKLADGNMELAYELVIFSNKPMELAKRILELETHIQKLEKIVNNLKI